MSTWIDALEKRTSKTQKKRACFWTLSKDKTTNCAPCKRQKIVSNTIITFCPVNLDNTNLRNRTSVHLWGYATLIVDEKGSTKIDFSKVARRQFQEKLKIF